jgi:poly(3-hydroxybutyrate) depolymerase
MMTQYLLCSSPLISSKIAAAVDIIGGIGAPMRGQCHPAGKKHVPLRILHGTKDPVIHYYEPTDVDGAPFLSTKDTAAMWKDLYGCGAEADKASWSDATTSCTTMCGARKEKLELCAMKDVGHDLNTPYAGYPFTVAFDWLSSNAKGNF